MFHLQDHPQLNDHFWRAFWMFELLVFVIVGVICWLLDVRTIAEYSVGLMAAGFVLVITAGAAQPDVPMRVHDIEYHFGLPLIDHSIDEQLIQQSSAHPWKFADLIQDVLVGIVPLVAGLALFIIF
jgi:hypothetical protein